MSAIERIRPWRRGAEQAPHKALLLLYALRRVQLGQPRLVEFTELEGPLGDLIQQFSPRARVHPEYPFWRLQRDGLWEVLEAEDFSSRKSNTDPPVTELRDKRARGGFPANLDRSLRTEPQAVVVLATVVARRFFDPKDGAALLAGLGLTKSDERIIGLAELLRAHDSEGVVNALEPTIAAVAHDGAMSDETEAAVINILEQLTLIRERDDGRIRPQQIELLIAELVDRLWDRFADVRGMEAEFVRLGIDASSHVVGGDEPQRAWRDGTARISQLHSWPFSV